MSKRRPRFGCSLPRPGTAPDRCRPAHFWIKSRPSVRRVPPPPGAARIRLAAAALARSDDVTTMKCQFRARQVITVAAASKLVPAGRARDEVTALRCAHGLLQKHQRSLMSVRMTPARATTTAETHRRQRFQLHRQLPLSGAAAGARRSPPSTPSAAKSTTSSTKPRPAASARLSSPDWRSEIDALYAGCPSRPVTIALAEALQHFNLPREQFPGNHRRHGDGPRPDALRRLQGAAPHCYRVASVVGLIAAEIFGYQDRRTLKYAHDPGLAFQLTNIIRDVGEDAARGRIYLPTGPNCGSSR